MPSISVNIATGADDGFNNITHNTITHGRYYSLTFFEVGEVTVSTVNRYLRNIALRFQSVNIPQGATISSATLTMIQQSVIGTPSAKVYGDNVNNAPAWGTTNRLKNISKTTNSATLNIASPSSTDVKTIIQEIVNRAGWASNNALALGVFNTKANTGRKSGSDIWIGYAYEKGGANIPNLSVTYTSGATGRLFRYPDLTGLGGVGQICFNPSLG